MTRPRMEAVPVRCGVLRPRPPSLRAGGRPGVLGHLLRFPLLLGEEFAAPGTTARPQRMTMSRVRKRILVRALRGCFEYRHARRARGRADIVKFLRQLRRLRRAGRWRPSEIRQGAFLLRTGKAPTRASGIAHVPEADAS